MRLALVLTAVCLSFTSCVGECTEIGCSQAVRFVLPGEAAMKFEEGPATVRTCINGVCFDSSDQNSGDVIYDATSRVLQVRHTVNFNSETTAVSLTVSRDGTQLFTGEWADVRFTQDTPNGPACPPTCRSAGPLTFPE